MDAAPPPAARHGCRAAGRHAKHAERRHGTGSTGADNEQPCFTSTRRHAGRRGGMPGGGVLGGGVFFLGMPGRRVVERAWVVSYTSAAPAPHRRAGCGGAPTRAPAGSVGRGWFYPMLCPRRCGPLSVAPARACSRKAGYSPRCGLAARRRGVGLAAVGLGCFVRPAVPAAAAARAIFMMGLRMDAWGGTWGLGDRWGTQI